MPPFRRSAALPALALFALALLGNAPLAAPESGRVTIRRDDWGIAHIAGKTDADVVYGLSYAQAEDDFPRIERNYLISLGRLAEADGESTLWQDLRQRLFVDPLRLKAIYAHSPDWLQRLMQAWAGGLNAFLADHPGVHPKVLTRFEPWMALAFAEGSIGADIERVPVSQVQSFYGGGRKLALTAEERGATYREPMGSNSIAIAPSHSTTGHALLLINPHTTFQFRSEVQLTSGEGLNAYGAATWGQFFIYQGFNAHAGWAITVSGIDNVDEYAETVVTSPAGPTAYRYGGAERPLIVRPITLAYRQADGSLAHRTFTTYATHHGPIVREDKGQWISVALFDNPLAQLEQSWLRAKAESLESFRKVLDLRANSTVNTAFADDHGHIAFFLPQFVARRDDRFDWRVPVDGSDPATDWQGTHDIATIPHVIDPANGWVYNANNDPWSAAGNDSPRRADFPRYMDQVGSNPRALHAETLLGTRRDFTLDGLVTLAYDPWLSAFDRLLPGLFAADAATPDAARTEPLALLRGWDHRTALDSTATTLAVFWGDALWARSAEAARRERVTVWDWMAGRTTPAEKLAALDEAVARLKADFGDWRVPWGEVNRYQRIDGALPPHFDDAQPSMAMPLAGSQWGALAAFKSQHHPGTKRLYGYHGNGFVAAVEFGPRVKARAISIGGASGDPASPHFADQMARYATGDLRPVLFYPDELAGHISATQVLVRK